MIIIHLICFVVVDDDITDLFVTRDGTIQKNNYRQDSDDMYSCKSPWNKEVDSMANIQIDKGRELWGGLL